MNTEWFEVTIAYDAISESGADVVKKEVYLVDAVSFGDAEERVYNERKAYITGDSLVAKVKRVKYAEIIQRVDEVKDKYYKARIDLITFDENSGEEKRKRYNVLVNASDFYDAVERLKDSMKVWLSDIEVISMQETPILEVFHYQEKDTNE